MNKEFAEMNKEFAESVTSSICSKSRATVGLPTMFGHARLSSTAEMSPGCASAAAATRPSISTLSPTLSPESDTMYGVRVPWIASRTGAEM